VASIEVIISENLPAKAAANGAYLISGLQEIQKKYSLIKEVRGRGLLIGVELEKPSGLADKLTFGMASKLSDEYLGSMVAGKLLNQHHIMTVYTLNNPNVIRLEPPLTVTREEIDSLLNAMDDILKSHKGLVSFAASSAGTAIKSFRRK